MTAIKYDLYNFGARGTICKRDYCHEEAIKLGLCQKHLEEVKSKKRRVKAKLK